MFNSGFIIGALVVVAAGIAFLTLVDSLLKARYAAKELEQERQLLDAGIIPEKYQQD